jgi:hypothetical protein
MMNKNKLWRNLAISISAGIGVGLTIGIIDTIANTNLGGTGWGLVSARPLVSPLSTCKPKAPGKAM